MYKEHDIFMLPTNDKATNIGKFIDSNNLVYNDLKSDIPRGEMQHLYVTSDEDIYIGDWFDHYVPVGDFHEYEHEIRQATSDYKNGVLTFIDEDGDTITTGYGKKIIATTDNKLIECDLCNNPNPMEWTDHSHNIIHQIHQSFVKSYVKTPVDKVLVEYKQIVKSNPCPLPDKTVIKVIDNYIRMELF